MKHAWTVDAARNNARWCNAVCFAHGKSGRFLEHMWVNAEAVPRFYPNAVTLSAADRDIDPPLIRAKVETGERGDHVDEVERRMLRPVDRAANLGAAIGDAGRGLVVHQQHALDLVRAILPKPRLDRGGMAGSVPALSLMRAVKDQFDPGHRMSPGRFPEVI